MKVHVGVGKDSVRIHSVVTTRANVHDLTIAAELLHGEEKVVYGDASYQGIVKSPKMTGTATELWVAMRLVNGRTLPEVSEGRLQDIAETAKILFLAMTEHSLQVIRQQFGFEESNWYQVHLNAPAQEQ